MKGLSRYFTNLAHERIYDGEYEDRHKRRAQDFTRKRKLRFALTMMFLLNFVRKSLQIEIDEFYDRRETPMKQRATMDAFIKAREKIKPSAFVELFEDTAKAALASDELPTTKEYRVFAVDGSELLLQGTKDILRHVGPSPNDAKRAAARLSILCEVRSGMIIDAIVGPLSEGERSMAMRHLEKFFAGKGPRDVVLMDRGYPSKALFAHFIHNDAFFLMRVQRSFNRQMDEAGYGESRITLTYEGTKIPLRVCKFLLSSGEEEILATNLPEEDFTTEELYALYGQRWGVETQYDTLKNRLQLERFSSEKWDYILQDFFATMFLSNIVAAASWTVNEELAKQEEENRKHGKTYKHPHAVSKNVLIGRLKHRLIHAIAADTSRARWRRMKKIFKEVSRCYDCVRHNRPIPPRPRKETHHKKSYPGIRAL